MARVPLVDPDDPDPVLSRAYGRVLDTWPDISNLYRTLGHSPLILEKWIDFAWTLRGEAVSARGIRELVIMRTAQRNAADYEWRHHYPMALEHGVGPEQLAELERWPESDRFSPAERAALAMAEDLAAGTTLSDAGWAALAEHFDEVERVELVLTAAFYACVSRVLGALEIDLEPRYRRYPPLG